MKSLTSSAELAASASACTGQVSAPQPSARRTRSAVESWPDTGPDSRSTPTSARSTPNVCAGTASGPRSSAAASRARTRAWPDAAPDCGATAPGCGRTWRIVGVCRPRWIIAENVPGLRSRGADAVVADLAALGYRCWPLVVGAVHAGAPHRRRRVFLVARSVAADARGAGLEMRQRGAAGPPPRLPAERRGRWLAEPGVPRVDDGFPGRVDRVKALGNAVVPDVAAMIGRAIRRAEAAP